MAPKWHLKETKNELFGLNAKHCFGRKPDTIHTVKHSGGNIMLSGCFSVEATERLVRIKGMGENPQIQVCQACSIIPCISWLRCFNKVQSKGSEYLGLYRGWCCLSNASPGAPCLPSRTPTVPDVTGRPKRSSRTSTTRATACSPHYHPEGEVSTGAPSLGPRERKTASISKPSDC